MRAFFSKLPHCRNSFGGLKNRNLLVKNPRVGLNFGRKKETGGLCVRKGARTPDSHYKSEEPVPGRDEWQTSKYNGEKGSIAIKGQLSPRATIRIKGGGKPLRGREGINKGSP